MQTPRQGVFGDSAAVVAEVLTDATLFLVDTAEVIPGLPAALGAGSDVNVGKLKSDPDTADLFYGAFFNLPINTFLGRTSLGEMTSVRGHVLRDGRLLVRTATFQDPNGSGDHTILPFLGTAPTTGDVGKLLDAVEVAPGADNPFTTTILKWQIHTAVGNGFTKCAMITAVSDDGSEVTLELFRGPFVFGAIV